MPHDPRQNRWFQATAPLRHVDPEEEKRIVTCKEDGGRHFSEVRRVAEITIDLVKQARAKMAENKVHGPEDSVVTEITKQGDWVVHDATKVPKPRPERDSACRARSFCQRTYRSNALTNIASTTT